MLSFLLCPSPPLTSPIFINKQLIIIGGALEYVCVYMCVCMCLPVCVYVHVDVCVHACVWMCGFIAWGRMSQTFLMLQLFNHLEKKSKEVIYIFCLKMQTLSSEDDKWFMSSVWQTLQNHPLFENKNTCCTQVNNPSSISEESGANSTVCLIPLPKNWVTAVCWLCGFCC